ncbi:MAG: alpha-amylase family glycosyl hydrolase [Patescibacteria group bacterium]
MNKKILILASIGIILLIGLFLRNGTENKILIEKPPQFYPMHFGAQLTFSSGDMFIGIDELKEQLKVIEETGADVIRIDMDYEAWMTNNQDNIKRHNEIIKQIKSDGKLLMLADRGAISFKKNKVTWDYFREQHLKHTRIFMERYKPDYYVVVKEPIWYYKFYSMISTNTTPEMWRDLASEACAIVKEVSPKTKCAVAVYASGEREKEFFALAADIANLDIMGVDVYDDKDIQATTNNLISLVPENKELWMLESWNGGASSYLQPWKENDDANWIKKSVYFSQKNNFSGYIAYYPLHFSSYTKLRDVDWSKRALPFYVYKSVIEEIRNKKQSETKDGANSIVNINKDESMPDSNKKVNDWIGEGAIYEVNIANFSTRKTYSELTGFIPKLKSLGIKTIYLLPIWNSIETQKNKTSGYSLINSELNLNYGTEEELKQLVNTVHANDMKILFDLVISYRPDTSVEYKNSPEMFLHHKSDNSIYKWRWEYSIDQTSPEFIARISDMAEYYVKNFDIDGWRIDAPQINIKEGDEGNLLLGNGKPIPPDYGAEELLKEVKRKITAIKPDAILFAEMPGPLCERAPETCDTAFDEYAEASYNWYFSGWLNYPTKLPIGSITYKDGFLDKIVNNKATSQEMVDYMITENIKNGRIRSHFSENHDTQRAQAAYPKQNKALLVMISTIPGVPMIFAGQEIGSVKKQVFDLSNYDTNSDIRQFYKKVFSIRNSSNALKYGGIKNVWKGGDNIYAYSRTYENETVIVVINFNGKQVESILDIPFPNGTRLKDEMNGEIFTVSDSDNFKITVPAYGSRILTIKR